jgi:hypothetical protein
MCDSYPELFVPLSHPSRMCLDLLSSLNMLFALWFSLNLPHRMTLFRAYLVMMLAIKNDQYEYVEAMHARQLMFIMYILGCNSRYVILVSHSFSLAFTHSCVYPQCAAS